MTMEESDRGRTVSLNPVKNVWCYVLNDKMYFKSNFYLNKNENGKSCENVTRNTERVRARHRSVEIYLIIFTWISEAGVTVASFLGGDVSSLGLVSAPLLSVFLPLISLSLMFSCGSLS